MASSEAITGAMDRALALAARARGATGANPMVGCVILDRGGRAVGEGRHERFGGPHAEVNALADARRRGHAVAGGTVVVTLEPCSHHGKTPPCADAVIAAQPARVVVAMRDPNPQVAGRGLKALRAAGIDVTVGLREREARLLNAAFLTRIHTGRPLVTVKYAMTLDGRTAARTGHSKWISSPASRERVHRMRGQSDAILCGIGTVLADDPQLTARPPGPAACRRFVIDPHLQTPPTSRLMQTAADDPVTLLCRDDALSQSSAPRSPGVSVVPLPVVADGVSIDAALDHLASEGIATLLVEGGGRTVGRFFDAGAVDEVVAFVAPKLVGGTEAFGPIGGRGRDAIPQQTDFASYEVERIGDDVLIRGLLDRSWFAVNSEPEGERPT